MRILVIEDEKRLAATLVDILENNGYSADSVHDGEEGLELAKSGIYDALILDVMLPGMNGYQILRALRSAHMAVPVLMLTAKSELADRVCGLDAGADYYLTKPFEYEELLACLRTILRRPAEIVSDTLSYGDLTLLPSASTLTCGGRSLILSAKEQELMRLLINNSSHFLPKETIFLKIWGYDGSVNANCVEAYISFLRKKLSLLQSSVRITVVRNIGYRLEEPGHDS